MSTVAVRATNRFADMLDWIESGPSLMLRDSDHFVRVEDFVRDDKFVVRAELPGVDPDQDIKLTVDGDYLTIHGERHEEKQDKNHSEFHYGSFSRSIRMPHGTSASDVSATYQDGILEVTLPMGEGKTPTEIPVTRPES
jgi:HSP20 family molecular chaperone IbpA